MDLIDLVTEVIDLRSFSNLWYWIALAVMWSSLSHWVLGIPYHMVQQARRGDARAGRDVQTLAEVHSRRILAFADLSGTLMVAASGFVVSALAMLGWGYGVEFAQAIILLLVPLLSVAALSILTARRVQGADIDTLCRFLRQHRLIVRVMGAIAIFVTAVWGMYSNVSGSVLY
ncbi:component of SufBCD complex [Rhodobacterales bacterium LSUCC0031]|nr:component of SufBCD complex [Rhodobacterales bacterium LSUCC0031]